MITEYELDWKAMGNIVVWPDGEWEWEDEFVEELSNKSDDYEIIPYDGRE